mmetsp:Transcript_19123/g.26582  ORF Transcript_19123/g.26582 Transcript_19123/m.26582 type:complete len:240 (-) Transcript_19123:89-808(-)
MQYMASIFETLHLFSISFLVALSVATASVDTPDGRFRVENNMASGLNAEWKRGWISRHHPNRIYRTLRLKGGGWFHSPWSDLLEVSDPTWYDGIMWVEAVCEEENWTHIVMHIPFEESLESKNFEVKFTTDSLYVSFINPESGAKKVLCDRKLHKKIICSESYWDVDVNPFDGAKGLRVVLRKEDEGWLWLAGFKEEELKKFPSDTQGDTVYDLNLRNSSMSNPGKRSAGYHPYRHRRR